MLSPLAGEPVTPHLESFESRTFQRDSLPAHKPAPSATTPTIPQKIAEPQSGFWELKLPGKARIDALSRMHRLPVKIHPSQRAGPYEI